MGTRGVVYATAGFLAFDTQERAQALGGGIMLLLGAFHALLGGTVALKLKRLRRGHSMGAILTKYREALVEAKSPVPNMEPEGGTSGRLVYTTPTPHVHLPPPHSRPSSCFYSP